MKRPMTILFLAFAAILFFQNVNAGERPNGPEPTAVSAARYIATDGTNLLFFPTPPTVRPNNCLDQAVPCLTAGHAAAQANPGDIIFAGCGLYEAPETAVLDKDLTITSHFADSQCVVLSTESGRVLQVTDNTTVSLLNLQVSGGDAGSARGGGIRVAEGAKLLLTNVTVRNNKARAGGGIYTEGALDLTISDVRGNEATERGGGIRVQESGTLLMTNSEVKNNKANLGGGIYSSGPSEMGGNSFVSLNEATSNGGGIIARHTFTIKESEVSENKSGAEGGGIRAGTSSDLAVINSSVKNNTAAEGGGLYVTNTTVRVDRSDFAANEAGTGGGIFVASNGTLTIDYSTLRENNASAGGGGLFNFGDTTARNSTFSENKGDRGGAIANRSNAGDETLGHLTLLSVTLAINEAEEAGGGLYNFFSGTVWVGNSLFSLHLKGLDCVNVLGAKIIATSTNLGEDGSCPGFLEAAPLLFPLEDNGGPTLTHMLHESSPALDAGDPDVCNALSNLDQRLYSRLNADGNGDPSDGNPCDLGAVERGAAEPPPFANHLPLLMAGN